MVEPQPSKLMVRVRFPSPAPLGGSRERLRQEAGRRRSRRGQAHMGCKVRHGAGLWLVVMEDG